MSTKEAALNAACIHYISACLAEGELGSLLTMGFERKDLAALTSLNVQDVHFLSEVRSAFAEVRVNRSLFLRQYDIASDRRRYGEYAHALLLADTPLELMHSLYGMKSVEFAARRKALGLSSGGGRAPALNDAQREAIWAAFEQLETGDNELNPADWVALNRTSGEPLRSCYRLVLSWLEARRPRRA